MVVVDRMGMAMKVMYSFAFAVKMHDDDDLLCVDCVLVDCVLVSS